MEQSNSRRFFMKTLAISAVAAVLAPVLKIQSAFSDEPVMANAADPLVKALGYVPNAKDAKNNKDKKAQCSNCQFYQGDAKAKSGKCQLIPSGEVMATGWCRSYSVKAKKA